MRVCRKCGEEKELELFEKDKKCKEGRNYRCKDCGKKARIAAAGGKSEYDKRRYQRGRKAFAKVRIERNHVYKMRSYKEADRKRGLQNDMDEDFCLIEMSKPCYYCGGSDSPMNGLDRVDNSLGHTKDNVVTSCHLCNMTRGDRFTVEQFKEFIAPGIKLMRKVNERDI